MQVEHLLRFQGRIPEDSERILVTPGADSGSPGSDSVVSGEYRCPVSGFWWYRASTRWCPAVFLYLLTTYHPKRASPRRSISAASNLLAENLVPSPRIRFSARIFNTTPVNPAPARTKPRKQADQCCMSWIKPRWRPPLQPPADSPTPLHRLATKKPPKLSHRETSGASPPRGRATERRD